MADNKQSSGKSISGVLRTGTGAGILVALAIILIFILAATFLKSLFFGIILACFLLPLEKFFENKFFQWPIPRAVLAFFDHLAEPLRRMRHRLTRKPPPTPGELAEARHQRLIIRSCICSALTFLAGISLVLFVIGYLLIPSMVAAGQKIKDSPSVRESFSRLDSLMTVPASDDPSKAPAGKETESQAAFRELVRNLRKTIPEYIKKNHKDFANLLFKGSRGIISAIIAVFSVLGNFLFNLLLTAFFFFFFLQQLAAFKSGSRQDESIGNWCVRGLLKTRWLPEVAESSRREAVEIIDWIAGMFVRWIHGYLWIMLIEIHLYLISFSLWNVPYAPVLAILSGMTILLPFLGLICNIFLSTAVCLIFCTDHVAGTLIGVYISYLCINGILEQLFLYPKLVGGAIELSTVETIIAVLLGGLAAGIPGMIFALPAASVLKYLVPKIYLSMQKISSESRVKGPTE